MEQLAKNQGIENLSCSQVSKMTKGLNEQVEAFHRRSLSQRLHPVLRVDVLYEKVRMDGRIVSMTVLVIYGVDEHGQRDILEVKPMLEELEDTYLHLFHDLQERGLCKLRLVFSDAHAGLVAEIRKAFPDASWQRCKVHFMRNILAHVPRKEDNAFAQQLKAVWYPLESRLVGGQKSYASCERRPRRFAALRLAWKTHWPSMPFHSWMPEYSLHQSVGTPEPRDPAAGQCGGKLS